MRDQVEQLQGEIERGVAALIEGEEWRRYLEVIARFPRYSARNSLLILRQSAGATLVGGHRTLKAMGLQVRAGERAIKILAPCLYRAKGDADEEVDAARVLRGFRVGHVFDVSQCDGQCPEVPKTTPLRGDAPEGLWERLAAQVTVAGLTLEREAIAGVVNGRTNFSSRVVTVDAGLSGAMATKVLCQELAHALLHDGTEYATGCRGRAEVEAESVAFVVCRAAELETEHYSFGYVTAWSGGDHQVVRDSAERVVTCARGILERAGLLDRGERQTAEAA